MRSGQLLDLAVEAFKGMEGVNRVSVSMPARPGKMYVVITVESDDVRVPEVLGGYEIRTEVRTKEQIKEDQRERRRRFIRPKARPCPECKSEYTINTTPRTRDGVRARCDACGHRWSYSRRVRADG